jgi:hypothetical protein
MLSQLVVLLVVRVLVVWEGYVEIIEVELKF